MDRIYRGYPQGLMNVSVQEVNPELMQSAEPYMVYNREAQQQWPGEWDEKRRIQAEYDYVRGLYPMNVRRWQRFVEEEFDRNDGAGSSIYDEYPDREWLYQVRNQIMRNAGEQGVIENKDVVLILMLHEMLRRRARRR